MVQKGVENTDIGVIVVLRVEKCYHNVNKHRARAQ
jgi:hypothetical protein